ncbi:MAG TPA: SPFH domain-containing protein [Dehalococcoidia bacterium]|nr:SPFH domain-containing protein [Dehalococcoidia bacterium]
MALVFKIVPEYQRVVRFTLGKYDGAPRGPGWVWVIPFIHSITTVDLREEVFDVEPQTCITKDNAPVTVDMLVFMRVVDPEMAVLKVQSYRLAARGMAITTLRAVVGDLMLDDVLAKREQINSVMQSRMDEVTDRWGVKVNAVEIREILPPRDIQEAMSRQMSAERNRRAVVTEAEGTREAAVTIATGNKDAAILNAEGAKQSAILNAEGARQAAILNAEGFSMALERIFSVANHIDEKTMILQYLDMMKALAGSSASKWIVPMELTSFVQGFARNLASAAGGDGAGSTSVASPPPEADRR